ncbi:MAG: M42 family metallopeptidase [Candidatus Heimdallarchaeota archaeon]|nr:M42 family metallopeptidase [Candidatus Heimdallarchaeota archaeon]MCK4877849.1 M42 family metallopeptidase [Candidatus Heimdallarchaeota archaeon]
MNIDRESVIKTQMELSNLIGCPGHEEEVTDYILLKLEKLDVDKAWIDPLGNVLAIKEGTDPNGLRILLDGHVDEVGFMISHIDDNGFLTVTPLGGIDKRIILGSLVQFQSTNEERIIGVFGTSPPHITKPDEREKVPETSDMFVDIGCNSYEEVREKGLDIGSVGTFYVESVQLNDNRILGKAFDDRTACNVILHVLEALKDKEISNTILVNFAVQEEVGARGATVGAYSLDPNIGLAIENTIASDVPGVSPQKTITKLGQGPAVTAADRSLVVPKKILERIKKAAAMDEIKWQYKKPAYGGTDAGRISLTKSGVPSGVVSVPCRYIHSTAGILHVDDILDTIKLVSNFCKI